MSQRCVDTYALLVGSAPTFTRSMSKRVCAGCWHTITATLRRQSRCREFAHLNRFCPLFGIFYILMSRRNFFNGWEANDCVGYSHIVSEITSRRLTVQISFYFFYFRFFPFRFTLPPQIPAVAATVRGGERIFSLRRLFPGGG